MPERVSVREDIGTIVVHSFGEVTEQDIAESRDLVVKLARERNYTRILVDATEETSLPSTMKLFDFGTSISGSDILRIMRFAVVISESTKEDLGFLETILQNRGVQVRIFYSMETALAWLST